jgi:large subunit ribosomal protein L3
MNGIIGKKLGMTSIFDDTGKNIPCTVIDASPNVITQVLSSEKNGYASYQLAAGERKAKNTSKQMLGHFEKAGTDPKAKLVEYNLNGLDKKLGDEVAFTELFNVGDKVNVIGVTKGKGFQGVVKRHGFRGVGDSTHGQHNRGRAPGSIGACATPSKVIKGLRMAGRMGTDRVKTKGLKVVRILSDQHLVLIKGCVPGHNGAFVIIEK